jgi:hypothetical protein
MAASYPDHNSVTPSSEASARTTFHDWSLLPTELKLEVLLHYIYVSRSIYKTVYDECMQTTLGA